MIIPVNVPLTIFRVCGGIPLTSAYLYNALGGKASSMSCQVVMHRHNHYHRHRYNQDYIAHQHRYEPSEEGDRLPDFEANRGRETSVTVTKEVSENAPPWLVPLAAY